MKKRILLTGGTGFFGKSLLDAQRRGALADCEFTVLARHPEPFRRDWPQLAARVKEFWADDVRSFSVSSRKFDAVIHAATPAVTGLETGEMRSIILDGTARVLKFCHAAGVPRLLFVSSGAVYGPQPPDCERLAENAPCRPDTEYGIAKREAELQCLGSGIPTRIARCFAFTGPYLNREIHFAVGNFIRDALAGCPIVIRGDGTPLRTYLYADDLVDWLSAVLERGMDGCVWNIGGDEIISIAALAERVCRVLNVRTGIRILGKPVPGTPPARYVPDVSGIQRSLGLRIRTPLDEAILRSAGRP